MNTVTVKIYEYDEESGALIAGFASDTTSSSNPDDYGRWSYQPANMWPHANTADEVMKELAKAGVAMCEEIVRMDAYKQNSAKVEAISSLVDTSATYNVSDLQDSQIVTPTPDEEV